MADARHFKKKTFFWPQLSSRLSDFSEILLEEAVFTEFR